MSEQDRSNSGLQGQSSIGMAPNIAGALSYVLGLITGIIIFALERENKFIRYHAMQSILASVAYIAISIAVSIALTILGFVPVINFLAGILGFLFYLVFWLGGLVVWILLIIKAFQGEKYSLPYIGEMAEKYANRQ
jgi:uncharacterized membrane protein